jgi:hypothetical protein
MTGRRASGNRLRDHVRAQHFSAAEVAQGVPIFSCSRRARWGLRLKTAW